MLHVIQTPSLSHISQRCQHLLAGGLGARDVGLGEGLGGLGRVLDGLAQDGKTALLAGDDTDGLENRSLVFVRARNRVRSRS